ncbi:hypothetical protein [Saccharibacillus sacchari]|uniref:Uncharacterized protein n=1 Tax=Saccharibacillus sacchari TaxID=456493 RepID=A0ACC6PJM6_9BACL
MPNVDTTQSAQTAQSLTSYSNVLLKSQFGKPADSIDIVTDPRCFVFIYRGLTDAHDSRLPEDPDERYAHIYILLKQFIYPSLRPKIEAASNQTISFAYMDWKIQTDTAMIAVFLHPEIEKAHEDLYAGKADLHQHVETITEKVQNPPISIESFRMEGDLLLIVRTGLLISLEKRLVKKGFNNELRLAKRELELERFIEGLPIKELLGKKMKNAFLDWAFEDDVSLLTLELEDDPDEDVDQ